MIVRQMAVQLGLRALAVAFALGAVALVPLAVSGEEYGRFALALSVCQLGAAVVFSWPNQGTLRYGREEFARHGHLGETHAARLLLHVGLLLPALLVAPFLAPEIARLLDLPPSTFTYLMLAALIVLPFTDIGVVAAQSIGQFLAYGLAQVLVRGAQLAVLAGIAVGALPALWTTLVLAALAGSVMAGLVSWLAAGKAVLQGWGVSRAAVSRLVVYGRLMVLARLSAFLVSTMDLWFIKAFLDTSAVGVYAFAYTISLLATSILVPITGILAPRAIDARVAGDRGQLLIMGRVFLAVTAFAMAIMPLGLVAVGCLAQAVDLGAYAASVAPALVILVATTFQLSMALMEPVVFAHERLVNYAVALMLGVAVVNAAVDVLLIPWLGIVGAAVGTACAFAAGTLMQWAMVRRALDMTVLPASPRLVVFGALPVAGALVWPLLPLWLAVLLSLGLSAALIFAARRSRWFAGFADLIAAAPALPPCVRGGVERGLILLAGSAARTGKMD